MRDFEIIACAEFPSQCRLPSIHLAFDVDIDQRFESRHVTIVNIMQMHALTGFAQFRIRWRILRGFGKIAFQALLAVIALEIKVDDDMILRYSYPMQFGGIHIVQCGGHLIPRQPRSSGWIIGGVLGRPILSHVIECRIGRIEFEFSRFDRLRFLHFLEFIPTDSLETGVASGFAAIDDVVSRLVEI